MFKILPILMGVVISYIAAILLNAAGVTSASGDAILNFSGVSGASFIGIPPFAFVNLI